MSSFRRNDCVNRFVWRSNVRVVLSAKGRQFPGRRNRLRRPQSFIRNDRPRPTANGGSRGGISILHAPRRRRAVRFVGGSRSGWNDDSWRPTDTVLPTRRSSKTRRTRYSGTVLTAYTLRWLAKPKRNAVRDRRRTESITRTPSSSRPFPNERSAFIHCSAVS